MAYLLDQVWIANAVVMTTLGELGPANNTCIIH